MKIFLIVALATGFVDSSAGERRYNESSYQGVKWTTTCIDSSFNNVKLTSRSEARICQDILDDFTAMFKSNVLSRLRTEDDQPCIMMTFKLFHINDVHLKGLVRHLHFDLPNNDEYEDDVDESIEALLKAVKVLCAANTRYAKEFDESYETHKQNNNTNDFDAELCARKYMFDNKIIDPADYNVSPIVNVVDCQKINEELDESFRIHDDETQTPNTFFGLSAKKAQDCMRRTYEEEKILQKIYSFNVIVHFGLTDAQRKDLRSKYISWMTSSVRVLLECIREIL